jgi:hypothetical protein
MCTVASHTVIVSGTVALLSAWLGNREQAAMITFVQYLVTGSGYLADERQLLGICQASYNDTELLRIVVQREKERRKKIPLHQKNFRPSSRDNPNPRTLLSYACEKEDFKRILLLISLGAATCFYTLPRAIECNRFEIVKLILEYDPTSKSYLIDGSHSCRKIVECRENIVEFAGLPQMTASDKLELGLTYNFPQLITDNLMEGTNHLDWIGWEEEHDWPVTEYLGGSYTYDDPLHLRDAGWVWIGVVGDIFYQYFLDLCINDPWDHESEALQALSRHPAFRPTERMHLAGKVKDASWVGELIDSNVYNSPDKVLSNNDILYGACCAGLTHTAIDMLELGASANAEGLDEETLAIHQAAWNEDEELVRALYNHGSFVDVALLAACYLGLTDIVADLLELEIEGVDANMDNAALPVTSFLHRDLESVETPLAVACARGHTQLIRYLFGQGAVFNKRTADALVGWGKVDVQVMEVLAEYVDVHILAPIEWTLLISNG